MKIKHLLASAKSWNLNSVNVRSLQTSAELKTSDPVAKADRMISWEARTPVKLRMTSSEPGNYPPILVPTMMRNTVEFVPNSTALSIKRDGQWTTWSFEQYYQDAQKVAKGFLACGLGRFEGVGIMGSNTPEWLMSSVGAIFAGGLSCGIYATNSPQLVSYISDHAPLAILVLEDLALLNKILDGRSLSQAFPTVKKVILVNSKVTDSRMDNVITWNQLLDIGASEPDATLQKVAQSQVVNEACMLIYTSGTTGPPKGAMLSHDNVTWSSRIGMETYRWDKELKHGQESCMSYLPLSHIVAHMVDCYMNMYLGATTYFADKDALKGTLVENLKEIRPTRFFGVPRVWEKIQEKMMEVGRQNGAVKKTVANFAKNAASQHFKNLRENPNAKTSLKYKIANKLVLSRIHEALGLDRVRGFYSGGAPLSLSNFDYFQSLGIVIEELYGSTECSGPESTNVHGFGNLKAGTVGRAYNGVNLSIINPDATGLGEVGVASRNVFMGYQRDEIKTKEAFTGEFAFRTGDLGRFDSDRFLTLSGRLKELIITSGGENIAPIPIEENIKDSLTDLVSQVVVVGDKRKYLTCLMTLKVKPDPETLLPTSFLDDSVISWIAEKADGPVSIQTSQEFLAALNSNSYRLRDAIQSGLDMANSKSVSNAQKVQKFFLLPNDFSILAGELGPTLKVKRYFIYEKYKEEIESMY